MMTIAELDAQTAEALPARETMRRHGRRGGLNFFSNNNIAVVNQLAISVAIGGRDATSIAENFSVVGQR